MENKNELTEKLKVVETEIYEAKLELKALNSRLEINYKYEDELLQRLSDARKKTESIRNEFFVKSTELSKKYNKIKNIVDIFTGNFYTL